MAKILVIDDEKSIRLTLSHFLEQEGHELHALGDALTAIEWLKDHDVDVIVTDIILPRVDGVELMQHARELRPDAKVIMITGEPTVETASEAVRAGAYDYLAKPVGKMDVIRCVTAAAKMKALEDDRRQLQRENRRYQDHLEELVRERTRELEQQIAEREKAEQERHAMQQQFLQAQKLEAVGRLAGGVAHDFNNILMALGGAAEFALEALAADDAARQDVEDIITLTDDAAALVRQLLAFSKQQALNRKPLDLNKRVGDLLKILRRLIGEDVDLRFSPSAAPSTVFADPGQIEQIVMNLAVNARDAMPGGGVLLLDIDTVVLDHSTSASLVDPESLSDGNFVCLRVTDNGMGIAPDTMEHLFEPFFTTKHRHGGTGLGLASVYGIVQQHHGGIAVESEPGEGTTFRLYFPPVAVSAAAVETRPEDRDLPRGTESILLVEDDSTVRETLARQLGDLGYNVTGVDSAEAALAHLRDAGQAVELLLTDLVLPGLTGKDLADKASAQRAGIKVVFMSGYSTDRKALEHIRATAVPFLSKPFPKRELANTVRRVLDG